MSPDNLPLLCDQDVPPITGDTPAGIHATLVRPPVLFARGAYSIPITPPLGVAYLAAVLEEAGATVSVVDAVAGGAGQAMTSEGYIRQGLSVEETVERIDPSTDLIGVSCMFTQDWPFTLRLIRAIRERFPDKTIVAGGEHITALPEFSLRQCPELDLCVLGEGEETLVDLIRRWKDPGSLYQTPGIAFLRDGQFVQTQPRQRIRNVDDLPLPAWHHFPMEVYLDNRNGHGVFRGRSMGILATRGCPYKCTFCSNPLMYGNLWVPRKPANVLDEIELYQAKYGVTNIDFYDLTFVVRKSWILEFCRLIEERGLTFTWQLPTGTRSEVIDEEVGAALYRTGCRNIAYAPESGSDETLRIIKKQVHLGKLVNSIRSVLREGMVVRVNLIVGFPHERRRHMLKTVLFGWKLALVGVQDAGFYLFSPYPGTELFDELRRDGAIGELDDAYFTSLLKWRNFFQPTPHLRHLSGREVAIWQFFGMASFYLLQYAVRPWRFFQMLHHVVRNRGVTALEQRLGVHFEHLRRRRHAEKLAAEHSSAAAASGSC